IWKTDTWKEEFQLPVQITEPVSGVAFATEGDLLAFAVGGPEERSVRVWRTDKTVRLMGPGGNTIATATGHADWVYAVAASPDGLRLASGSGDGTVKIWGPAGKLLLTLGEGTTQP